MTAQAWEKCSTGGQLMNDGRFPIWGGPALGLIIGLVVGVATGNVVTGAVLGVLIGAAANFAAGLLGAWADRQRDRY